jgi:bifunctional UDP-N-acetylglucosamine pyrophosphorylase / glucosamine-1-phosphate N-acetyltransferase
MTPIGKGKRHVVVLAAGKSTRFKSDLPKVLHRLCGKTLLGHVLDKLPVLVDGRLIVVIGPNPEVEEAAAAYGAECVLQEPQKGTGHAVISALPALQEQDGSVLVLYGDAPLIRVETLERLFRAVEEQDAEEALLTVETAYPEGYGRIIRDAKGEPVRVVEEKDASATEKTIREINAGFACFKLSSLRSALPQLRNDNQAGEYYLTDLVEIFRAGGSRVVTVLSDQVDETLGVNSREELAQVETLMRADINRRWMREGVTILNPATVSIDAEVILAPDTTLYPGVIIEGTSQLGQGCTVMSYSHLRDVILEEEVLVDHCSVIRSSTIGRNSQIGPFAHIRENTFIGARARVGNFVEVKKCQVGDDSKAAHLTYLGDAQIGRDVNIGAGTITCNYDGINKNRTVIEDEVFIGSDTQLIAPVTVHKGAYVAAGSSITEDVPEYSLGIARGRQINKEGWAAEKARQRAEKARRKKKP